MRAVNLRGGGAKAAVVELPKFLEQLQLSILASRYHCICSNWD